MIVSCLCAKAGKIQQKDFPPKICVNAIDAGIKVIVSHLTEILFVNKNISSISVLHFIDLDLVCEKGK